MSSIKVRRLAVFSTSDTLAKASGEISFAEGCGGKGWPAGIIARRAAEIGMPFSSSSRTSSSSSFFLGAAAGAAVVPVVAFGFGAGFGAAGAAFEDLCGTATHDKGWRERVGRRNCYKHVIHTIYTIISNY